MMKKITPKADDMLYSCMYKFREQSDYEAFLEAQIEYPKLRRFIEELENELRSWRKYGEVPELLKPLKEYLKDEDSLETIGSDIERWWYSRKEEWGE